MLSKFLTTFVAHINSTKLSPILVIRSVTKLARTIKFQFILTLHIKATTLATNTLRLKRTISTASCIKIMRNS